MALGISVGVVAYLGFSSYRALEFYRYVKRQQTGVIGKIHQADPALGFGPIPGADGVHFVGRERIPTRFNRSGFREQVSPERTEPDAPTLLALGCSFTYGDSVSAADAFPQVVGNTIGAEAMKAGINAYGLAQMLVRRGR